MPTASKKAAAAAPKAKRKQLTPAERIAKAEADLEALRAKATEQGAKKSQVIDAKIKAATDKRNKLNGIISALEAEKAALLPADSADGSESSDS